MPAGPSEPVPLAKATLEALAAMSGARVFDLGATIEEAMPQWPDEGSRRLTRSWMVAPSESPSRTTFAVEQIRASLHTSTHIDAVVHVQFGGLVHGGEAVATAAGDGFFKRGGVESIAPIITPYVLIDAARAAGVAALPDDAELGPDELQRALARQGVSVERGSAVLVRTGKMRSFADGDAYLSAQPGLSVASGEWLAANEIAVLGSDTAGTEPLPSREPVGALHKLMLFDRGIHLVENLLLDQLSASERWRGIFICLPLKLVGATASWVRPVAIA